MAEAVKRAIKWPVEAEEPSLPRWPAHKFTYENSGGVYHEPWPFFYKGEFTYRLKEGWGVLGWCWNRRLGGMKRREQHDNEYIAVMFESPEGHDLWYHFGWHGFDLRFVVDKGPQL